VRIIGGGASPPPAQSVGSIQSPGSEPLRNHLPPATEYLFHSAPMVGDPEGPLRRENYTDFNLSIVQDYVQQRRIHLNPAVVFDEA
jgi:hypothetical protein